jgi:hypothetical protein
MSSLLKIEEYLYRNRYFLAWCLGISLLVFGFEVFHATLSIDEEASSLHRGPMQVFINHDRWAMYVLSLLFQWGPSLPYFHILIAIFANLTAFHLSLHLWAPDAGRERYPAAVFAMGYPMMAFVYEFNIVQYGYYIGLIFAVAAVAVYVQVRQTATKYFLTILLLILALAVYQSLFFAAPVVYFVYLAGQYLMGKSKPSFLVQALFFGGCLIAAVILHGWISGWLRHWLGITDHYQAIDRFYAASYLATWRPVFVIREIGALLLGQRWYVGYLTGVVIVISHGLLFYRIWHLPSNRLPALICISLAVLAPFSLVAVTGQPWPVRTFISLPLLLAGIVLLAVRLAPVHLKFLLAGLTLVCLVYYWGSSTRLFYTNYIVWQRDKLLTNRVVQRLEDRFGSQLGQAPVPLVITGTPSRPDNQLYFQEETAGGSLWDWDGGVERRILSMFQILGVDYFRVPTREERLKGLELAKTLENWPSERSVAADRQLMVIRFGPPNQRQLQEAGLGDPPK